MNAMSKTAVSCLGSIGVSTWLLIFLVAGFLLTRANARAVVSSDGAAETQYYVSTTGNDSSPGSETQPFRTVSRAQQAVQALKKAHGGHVPVPGVVVNVASGAYDFSTAPFQLTSADSGEAGAPVTYKGAPGSILSGGRTIPTSAWQFHKTVELDPDYGTVAPNGGKGNVKPSPKFNAKTYHEHHRDDQDDRSLLEVDGLGDEVKPSSDGHAGRQPVRHVSKRQVATPTVNVMKADLKKLGITDYGKLESGMLGDCANNKLEAFYAGRPLDLARYPNLGTDGKPQFMNIAKVLDKNSSFQFDDKRLASVKDASSMWMHGYWGQDWADNYVRVVKLDGATSTVTSDPATPPVYGYHKPARFYALNTLEFLDSPGEYYLDRTTGVLYFALPTNAPRNDLPLTVSLVPTVLSLDNVSFLTLDGIDVMYSREVAVTSTTTLNFTMSNSVVAGHGGRALRFSGASNTLIHNISAHGIGCAGLSLEGGILSSLARGNSVLQHSTVHDFALWKRTYNPGIAFGGVGNSFVHNTVYGGPHSAMLGSCNDCLFAYNNISDMCYESTDTGAFYTGRSWIRRGNVMHNNIFSHIRTTEHTVLGAPSVQAIYLDDQMSGFEIFNNTFIDCQKGTFIGGGRRNHVYNNYYEDCDDAVHLDARGLTWQKASCSKDGTFFQEMEAVHYDKPPWSTHYPELLTIFNEHPCYPTDSSFTSNTYCKCKHFADVSDTQIHDWYATASNNVEKCN